MKRKRLEAWAIVNPSEHVGPALYPTRAKARARHIWDGDKIVHLVEEDKRAAAVVRAAVKWATGEKYGGSVGLAGDLLRAVERMQKGRK